MSEVTKNSEKEQVVRRQPRCCFSEWLLIYYYTTSFYIDVEVVRRLHTSHPRQFSMIALIESPRGVSISSSSSSLLLFSPAASIQQHKGCHTRSLSQSQTDFFMKLVFLTVYLYVRFSFSSLAHINLPICTGILQPASAPSPVFTWHLPCLPKLNYCHHGVRVEGNL